MVNGIENEHLHWYDGYETQAVANDWECGCSKFVILSERSLWMNSETITET